MNQKRYLDITPLPITTTCWHSAGAVTPDKKAMMPTTLKTNNKNPYSMKKFLLYLMIPVFLLLSGMITSRAQTTLSAGDIVLLAFNGDGEYSTGITQDGFSFMPLVNLEAGTEIYFTEIGWSDLANAFIYSTEINDQMVKYTAPTPIAAGTIIRNDEMNTNGFTAYSSNTTYTTAFFEVFNNGNGTGEELLVFQGSRATPTFIFAVSHRPAGWETNVPAGGVTTGDGSALPPGLINDVTCFIFSPR